METEGSLPHSQEPTISPYCEPDQSIPCPHLTSWRSILILSSHLRMGLPSALFRLGLPSKSLYAPLFFPIYATCLAHIILLNLITRIIFGEKYRSFSSSLYSFLHPPVTSSLLGPNILLGNLRFSLNVSDQDLHPYKTTRLSQKIDYLFKDET